MEVKYHVYLITPETVVPAAQWVYLAAGKRSSHHAGRGQKGRTWSERENLVRKGEPGQKGRTLLLVKGSVKQKKRIGGYKTLT